MARNSDATRSAALALALAAAASAQMCLPTQDGADLLKERGLSMAGKTVVLTGGSSGVGYGIASAIASAGAKLIMLGYHAESANAAAANITKATGNSDIHVIAPFDLSSFKSVDAAAAQVVKMAPKIDVLVCDAGLNSEHAGMQNITEDGFEITFQVTFLGHFKLTEMLLPQLRAAKGRVVNTGSVTNGFHNLSYSVTMFANETMCGWQGFPGNCMETDFIKTAVKRTGATLPFGQGVGLSYYALTFKTWYAHEFSAREAANGVSMYTGHPGLVDSVQNGGLNNKTVVSETCEPLGWMGCCCATDPSLKLDLSICPLSPLRGGGPLAWLAAAPKETIEATPARFFSLCVPLPPPANQYAMYADARGNEAAAAHARELTALWKSFTE